MKVSRITFQNFRGAKNGTVLLDGHSLLVGGNSVGKSTICDALDLVIGPERMTRRPVVDEHDFYAGEYLTADGTTPEIKIEVILTDLSDEARRRFHSHLRVWSPETGDLLDSVTPEGIAAADQLAATPTSAPAAAAVPQGEWCLPVVFLGRFDPEEDDFIAGTFFAFPQAIADAFAEDGAELGAGLKPFKREDKRMCGFIYLRANRTGSRALSFQRGSLIDTIVRLEAQGTDESLWERAVRDVNQVVVTGEGSGFAKIRTEVRKLVSQFIGLTDDDNAIDVHVSDLTREHLREVLRLFVSTQPGTYPVPFNRLSTGSLNLLVFALLTYIAGLTEDQSVIFAMEEPEIALPPHSQRRLVRFVLEKMGQVIVTSHSPYVIEMFDPDHIVAVARDDAGAMTSLPVNLPADYKVKKYRTNQRQFAEAVLARAVCVVEGGTEVTAIRAVADVLEQDPASGYQHLDLVGISLFDAGNDISVPLYAPVFANMGKPVFGIHDQPDKPLTPEQTGKAAAFAVYEVIPYQGIEKLLAAEIPAGIQRRFWAAASGRSDYPAECGILDPGADDDAVRAHTISVLKKRKGPFDGYAHLLVAECSARAELPATVVAFLEKINGHLTGTPMTQPPSAADGAGGDAGGA